MSKKTKKYVEARRAAMAGELLAAAELREVLDNAPALYAALERAGWFWDVQAGLWNDVKKSTSMFQTDAGLSTGAFRLRVMAHPGDVDRLLHILSEALDTYGCRIYETSNAYPNRRGPGLRVYLSCQLPDKEGKK